MKRAILAALVLLGAASHTANAGRGNMVTHVDRNGAPEEILASQGNCRHHMSAHPLDVVHTGHGPSKSPDDCN